MICDPSVAGSALDSVGWVADNAGESFLETDWETDGVTPCLFVYPKGDEELGSAETCKPAACTDNPNVNDAVYEGYGVWSFIEPLL